jgi:hypothetical protein
MSEFAADVDVSALFMLPDVPPSVSWMVGDEPEQSVEINLGCDSAPESSDGFAEDGAATDVADVCVFSCTTSFSGRGE